MASCGKHSKKDEISEQLIELVRVNPVLYDKSSGLFRNRYLKDKAWENISEAMGLPVLDAKSNWRGLCDTFMKEERKRLQPSGSACTPPSMWKHHVSMIFLRNMVQTRETTDNIGEEYSPSEMSSTIVDCATLSSPDSEELTPAVKKKSRKDADEIAVSVLKNAEQSFAKAIAACIQAREPGPVEEMMAAVRQQLDEVGISCAVLLRLQSKILQVISEKLNE